MKHIGSLLILLLLSGCTTGMAIKENPEITLHETESLADSAYTSSDWFESEKYYSILVTSGPKQPLHWYRLGNIYAFTNRPDAAVSAYHEALTQDPELIDAWYNMGLIQLKQAASSFSQLQLYIDQEQDTAEQGRKILQGILDLIQVNETE